MSERKIINFIHIPRTGGSSFKYAMKKGCYDHGYFNDSNINLEKYTVVLNGHGQKLVGNSIFFIRDPAERFVSSFWGRYNQGKPLYHGIWMPEERESFELFKTPNQLAEAIGSKKAKFAMNSIQHVNAGLSDWLVNEDYLLGELNSVFFVGRTSHLSEDFEILKKKLDIGDNYKLPDDFKKRNKIASCDKRLSAKAINNLKEWYKEDYELIKIIKDYFKFNI